MLSTVRLSNQSCNKLQRSRPACINWQQGGKTCCSVCKHFRLFCMEHDNCSCLSHNIVKGAKKLILKVDSSSNTFQVILQRYLFFQPPRSRLHHFHHQEFQPTCHYRNAEGKNHDKSHIFALILSIWNLNLYSFFMLTRFKIQTTVDLYILQKFDCVM